MKYYRGYTKVFLVLAVLSAGFSLILRESVCGQMLDRSATRVQTTLKTGWIQIGSLKPRSVTEIEGDQNWTLGCETLDRDYIYWDTYKEYVAPLGIKRIRLQAGWAKTEQKPGVYDFAWLDYVVDDALERGLQVWLETDYGNPIYPGGGDWDLGAGFPTSEEGLAAWDRWVEQLATRYKDKVQDWAMWNEPDIGKKKTPEAIARFNIRTAEIIKKVIPNARIGALSLATNNPAFTKQCLDVINQEGKLPLFTWLIYHGYAKNPDSSYANVDALQKLVDQYEHKLKLWQGENGCPSEKAHKFALSNYPWSELTQAKWDSRRMLGDLGRDVVSAVFTICDFDHTGREINRKGLLKINDKTNLAKVKMAYYAVQNVVTVFDGSLERQKSYNCTVCPSAEVPESAAPQQPITWFAYRDGKRKQDVLVLWDGSDIPQDENKTQWVDITVKDGQFSDPVWVDLITGAIREIPADQKQIAAGETTLKKIPVYDAPIVIMDRVRALPMDK